MVVFLLLLGLVIWAGNSFGNWAGILGIGLLVVMLVCMFCSAWSKDSKAYGNWIDYWSKGGPDRDKRRR